MSLNEIHAQHHENITRVLLVGFEPQEQDNLTKVLQRIGWQAATATDLNDWIENALHERVELTVIDIDNIALYAPMVVAKARASGGASANTAILAVGGFVLAELKEQLLRAGVDLVIPKPNDPKLYIPNLVRAASIRLSSVFELQP